MHHHHLVTSGKVLRVEMHPKILTGINSESKNEGKSAPGRGYCVSMDKADDLTEDQFFRVQSASKYVHVN